ncbi:MAG TPA: ATP-binding protein [Jiangellaceae bacterium]
MATSSQSVLQLQLAARPTEVPRVRRAVRTWLRSMCNRCDWRTAELLVSELVTNALVHALPPLELRVRPLGATGVRIEVSDAAGSRWPTKKSNRPDAEGGRGIEIVAALATRWGTESSEAGKLVWAEID